MRYYLIMLAAGFSRRFGSNKLLHEIDGKPMYRYTFEKLEQLKKREDVADIIVVSQYSSIEADAAKQGFHPVHNANSALGISSSLKLGLLKALELREGSVSKRVLQGFTGKGENLLQDGSSVAFLYMVGDQPFLRVETVEKMLDTYTETPGNILCLQADGRRGNPVIFGERFTPELLELEGDTGGKQVMKKHPEEVTCMEADPKELMDIDHI